MGAVGIPVIAKCRIGHFVEAQVWEAMGVHLVDETEGQYHTTLYKVGVGVVSAAVYRKQGDRVGWDWSV